MGPVKGAGRLRYRMIERAASGQPSVQREEFIRQTVAAYRRAFGITEEQAGAFYDRGALQVGAALDRAIAKAETLARELNVPKQFAWYFVFNYRKDARPAIERGRAEADALALRCSCHGIDHFTVFQSALENPADMRGAINRRFNVQLDR